MFAISRRFVAFFMVLLLLVLLVDVIPLSAEIKRGGTITVGVDQGAAGFDPMQCIGAPCWNHVELIYENLVRYNKKMEIVPCLAKSWEQPDPLTYIFHLRKGVKWHNGREFVADDVKYSYERAKDPQYSAMPLMWKALKIIEVLDKYTVRFNLSSADTILMPKIAYSRYSAIVPRDVIEKQGSLKTIGCGTGPFKLKEFVAGDYTVYERNPDYWEKGLPRVDKIVFKVIKDETSRMAALRRGAVDLGWLKEIAMAKQIQKQKGLRVLIPPMGRQTILFLNNEKFPFDNKRLRQALSATFDREDFIKSVLMGFGEICSCIPPATAPFALPKREVAKLPFYKRDLELSKRLLKEGGYPNGFEFTIVSSAHSPDYMAGAQIIQEFCKDVGIKAKIEQVEWGIHLKKWKESEFQALILGNSWQPAPDEYVRHLHSKMKPNHSRYKNPVVDQLLEESRITYDQKKRIEIWKKIQHIVAEDVPTIWCASGPLRNEVVRDYIKDYQILFNMSRAYLREAWLDK